MELSNKSKISIDYPNTVGDISFDSKLDDPNFRMCRDYKYSPQYYMLDGFKIEGEMAFVKKKCRSLYNNLFVEDQSGFITIRFVINCKGETGRFRVYSLDEALNEFEFSDHISQQILEIVKGLKGWKVQKTSDGDIDLDYYQYLTFHIKQGKLVDIAP